MRTTLLLILVLGLGACDGEGLPPDETTSTAAPVGTVVAPVPVDPVAPAAPAPAADAAPSCAAGLTAGQSVVDTTVGCMVIESGSGLQLGPTYRINAVWVGPRARLCWGDNGNDQNPCVDNATDAPVLVPNVYLAPVFTSIPL